MAVPKPNLVETSVEYSELNAIERDSEATAAAQ
jgi:hypothetical protein